MTGGDDAGGATVWALAAGLVALAFAVAVSAAGAAMVARHRAQAAADLGALAGAVRAIDGEQVACARAADLVARNDGALTACRLDGLDVIIAVTVDPPALIAWAGGASASARAGPV